MKTSKSIDEKTAENLAFFQKVGKMGKQIDLEKAIRDGRDKDLDQKNIDVNIVAN